MCNTKNCCWTCGKRLRSLCWAGTKAGEIPQWRKACCCVLLCVVVGCCGLLWVVVGCCGWVVDLFRLCFNFVFTLFLLCFTFLLPFVYLCFVLHLSLSVVGVLRSLQSSFQCAFFLNSGSITLDSHDGNPRVHYPLEPHE